MEFRSSREKGIHSAGKAPRSGNLQPHPGYARTAVPHKPPLHFIPPPKCGCSKKSVILATYYETNPLKGNLKFKKLKRKNDLIFNVVVPLAIGTGLYCIPTEPFLRNYVPDGLWAYSLVSLLLILWDRILKPAWMGTVFLLFLLFELLQKRGMILGTGDGFDILAYTLSALAAIGLNAPFKSKFNTKDYENKN